MFQKLLQHVRCEHNMWLYNQLPPSSLLPPLLIIHAFGHLAVVFCPPGPVDQLNLAHCWYFELMGEFFFTTLKRERNPGD